MAVKTFTILIILIGFNVSRAFPTKPLITPNDSEYILHSGQNFSLSCSGDDPVIWEYPNPKKTREPEFSITSDFDSSTHHYVTTLQIWNATTWDVGFYYCSFRDININSSIYLYVEDAEDLFAKDENSEDVFMVQGKQYSPLTIPCRPSSPNVQVDLYEAGDEVDITKSNISYDPKTGFTFNESPNEYFYTCNFTKGSDKYLSKDFAIILQIFNTIPKPSVEIVKFNKNDYTTEGDSLFLRCTIVLDEGRRIRESWFKDDAPVENKSTVVIHAITSNNTNAYYTDLRINPVKKEDAGLYTCKISDDDNISEDTINVSILSEGEHFLNLSEENNLDVITAHPGMTDVKWRIDIQSHPPADITWLDNKNRRISPMGEKYHIVNESTYTILTIHRISIIDRGNYTLRAVNERNDAAEFTMFLDVTDKPTVKLNSSNFHMVNRSEAVQCIVAAYPEPEIYWEYKPCQSDSCSYEPIPTPPHDKTGLRITSTIYLSKDQSGYVKCFSNNSLGYDEYITSYIVTDVENGFGMWALENDELLTRNEIINVRMATGDHVVFHCAAVHQNYTSNITWYFNDMLITNNDYYTIERSHTIYSNRVSFTINSLSYNDTGTYACKVREEGSPNEMRIKEERIILTVVDPEMPAIIATNLDEDLTKLRFPYRRELYCYANGVPKPKVTWHKGGSLFLPDNKRTYLEENGQRIVLNETEESDEGEYTCNVANLKGSASKSASLKFQNSRRFNYVYIIVIVVLIIVLAMCGIGLTCKVRKERKLENELRLAGLANFEKGAVECLNPELGIDDQAELLPYDKDAWEIPREKMKLGKQLGSGAFGVVMKAEVEGIVEGEESSMVAVKMVKKNADNTFIKALASELKIMVHLGKHLNVVNLIGACTKNITKRELYVVVEYCRFGNTHNYLLRHRQNFIDQIDPKTAKIDYGIGAEILERSFSVSSNQSHDGPPKDMMDYRGNANYSGVTQNTDVTTVCMTPTGAGPGDEALTSSSSTQPEWRSNYKGDYKGNVKPICTKDLLTWAFQVSRGMEYLASRKVLHGDLAARNILLADSNIVKICDFGLAKTMYKSDNYKKKGDGPLPIKWMAVESIRDRVFSTQSDVWSFGIVLWEFFSLARTPYPGMEADERLYQKLVEGYRMDIPTYATEEIYQMMKDCWEPKPLRRPSFTRLAERIGNMLEDSVKKHYIDLNDPYLIMNTKRFNEGHSDYLQMVSPPDFQSLSSPHHYVNESVTSPSPNHMEKSSYLFMKPAQIFSPREMDDEVFTFSEITKKHKDSEGAEDSSPELIPMLNMQADSDYESSSQVNSPKTPGALPPSFSNPIYHHLSTVKPPKEIVKNADNYVNMPKNKSAIKNEMNGDTDTKEKHYVNHSSRDWESVTKV